jgi:hypothetical protein
MSRNSYGGPEHIIVKSLEKDRKPRYQSTSEIRADLLRVNRDVSLGSRETSTTSCGFKFHGPFSARSGTLA